MRVVRIFTILRNFDLSCNQCASERRIEDRRRSFSVSIPLSISVLSPASQTHHHSPTVGLLQNPVQNVTKLDRLMIVIILITTTLRWKTQQVKIRVIISCTPLKSFSSTQSQSQISSALLNCDPDL